MSTASRKAKINQPKAAALALSALLVGNVLGITVTPALAQSIDLLSETATPDTSASQESLLPPEVVPFDSQTASRMASSEAQARQAYQSAQAPQMQQPAAPGMALTPAPTGEMQSAQDFRKAAMDSLTNRTDVAGIYGNQTNRSINQNLTPNTYAGNQSNPQLSNSMSNPGMAAQPGQSPWMVQGQQPGASTMAAPQSQTLSGGVNQATQQNQMKPSSTNHGIGLLSFFGMGIIGATMMRGSSLGGLSGLGMMGSGLGNYAVRNGFRF